MEDNHLHLKRKFLLVEASKIDDFPKLDENTIKTSITLGSYQLKQAKSYLAEHLNNGKIMIRINKKCLEFENSKILFSIINPDIRKPQSMVYIVSTIQVLHLQIQLNGGIVLAKVENV